jgi:hypothetical protein
MPERADETPPSQWTLPRLRVDVDGEWYESDGRVTHPGVLKYLRRHLRRDADGYFIPAGVRVPVEVDDVPWVVVRIERVDERLRGTLNDGTEGDVDPGTLRIGPRDVPYCTVDGGRFEARLSRSATYQLLTMVEPVSDDGIEVLALGGRTYPLRSTGGSP